MSNLSAPTPKYHQLKHRIITALVLTFIIVIAIFLMPNFEFALGAALLLAIGGGEWAKLIGLNSWLKYTGYLGILFAAFFVAYHFALLTLIIGIIWWLLIFIIIIRSLDVAKLCIENKLIGGAVGLLILVPCWTAIVVLHHFHPGYLLYGLFWVWSADTGAYIAGHLFGKHKLAPRISPGKTWEGVMGGIVCTLIFAGIGGWLLKIHGSDWRPILLLAVIVALTSVIGDLFESLIKRCVGVKDSGNWLPGHGGLLDRIDGLTAAMPFFALGIILIRW